MENPNLNPKTEKPENNLENEFKINQEMEIQADILGINLEKLKSEINAMGGPEKFRELANKGLQKYENKKGETEYYDNRSEGEKVFRNLAGKLSSLCDFFGEKAIGIFGGASGAALITVAEVEAPSSGVSTLVFYMGIVLTMIGSGGLILAIKKKIQHNKTYFKAKIAEMKLEMTGSVNRKKGYLDYDPKEQKLKKEVREKQGKILTEEQEKNPKIGDFL